MRRAHLSALILLTAMSWGGCDQSPQRQAIYGQVTVDGRPLTYGTILFDPEASGPRAAASIRNGTYQIESTRGPLSGPMLVVIHAPKFPADLPLPDNTSELADLALQYPESLPARFNANTELRAMVTEEGPNEFNFSLQTE